MVGGRGLDVLARKEPAILTCVAHSNIQESIVSTVNQRPNEADGVELPTSNPAERRGNRVPREGDGGVFSQTARFG